METPKLPQGLDDLAELQEHVRMIDEQIAQDAYRISKEQRAALLAKYPQRLKGPEWIAARKPMDHLITGYLPRKGIGQMYGPPYSGKSYAAVDLALCVASGQSNWLGLPLRVHGPQRVLYVAAEGGQPFWDAVEGWLKAHPNADLSLLRVLDGGEGDALYLTPPDESPDLKNGLGRLEVEVEEAWGQDEYPVLVILDPQINIMPEVDEQSNREMVKVLALVKRWSDANNWLTLLVHHTGHNTTRARGASGQLGVMDVVMHLEGKNGTGAITFDKVKGAAKPADSIKFRIEGVDIEHGSKRGAYMVPDQAYVTDADVQNMQADFLRARVKAALREGDTSVAQIATRLNLSRNTVAPILAEIPEATNTGSTTRPVWKLQ